MIQLGSIYPSNSAQRSTFAPLCFQVTSIEYSLEATLAVGESSGYPDLDRSSPHRSSYHLRYLASPSVITLPSHRIILENVKIPRIEKEEDRKSILERRLVWIFRNLIYVCGGKAMRPVVTFMTKPDSTSSEELRKHRSRLELAFRERASISCGSGERVDVVIDRREESSAPRRDKCVPSCSAGCANVAHDWLMLWETKGEVRLGFKGDHDARGTWDLV